MILRTDKTLEQLLKIGTRGASGIRDRLAEQTGRLTVEPAIERLSKLFEANTRFQLDMYKGVNAMPCGKKSKPKGSKVKTKKWGWG